MSPTIRPRGPGGFAVIVLVTLLAAACGGTEGGAATTAAPSTTQATTTLAPPTTQATTTVPPTTAATTTTTTTAPATSTTVPAETVPYLDVVFGLVNLLLTTDEAGGGWIDQGRIVRPPADLSFLCPAGLAVLETPGSNPAVEVGTMLRLNGPDGSPDLGLWIDETVMLPDGDTDLFATWVAALDACAEEEPWQAPNWGIGAVERVDVPAHGDESAAFRMTMDEGTGEPWIEARLVLTRIGPLVMGVEAGAVLDPDATESSVGDAEWLRVAEAAVSKASEAMAEAPDFVAGEPDAGSDLAISLLDRLLTAEEIGGGWIDQGRIVFPTQGGRRRDADLLCPEGSAIAEGIGDRLDPAAQTRYRMARPPEPGAFVTETLTGGAAAADFDTWITAMDSCLGTAAWEAPDGGPVTIERLEMPDLGAGSAAFAFVLGDPDAGLPWIEWHHFSVLAGGTVVEVSATVVHDPPDQEYPEIDDAELIRITEIAVEKVRGS